MTHNQELRVLHVNNSTAFAESVEYGIVEGDTLLLDFVFYLHPVSPLMLHPCLTMSTTCKSRQILQLKSATSHLVIDNQQNVKASPSASHIAMKIDEMARREVSHMP